MLVFGYRYLQSVVSPLGKTHHSVVSGIFRYLMIPASNQVTVPIKKNLRKMEPIDTLCVGTILKAPRNLEGAVFTEISSFKEVHPDFFEKFTRNSDSFTHTKKINNHPPYITGRLFVTNDTHHMVHCLTVRCVFRGKLQVTPKELSP